MPFLFSSVTDHGAFQKGLWAFKSKSSYIFKGYLWNSTLDILPKYWNIRFLCNFEILGALIFFKCPPVVTICLCIDSKAILWLLQCQWSKYAGCGWIHEPSENLNFYNQTLTTHWHFTENQHMLLQNTQSFVMENISLQSVYTKLTHSMLLISILGVNGYLVINVESLGNLSPFCFSVLRWH